MKPQRRDLKLHRNIGFALGFVVTVVTAVVLHRATLLPAPSCIGLGSLAGCLVGYATGWLKEYWWDAKGRGTVDADDLRWTYRGAALGSGIAAAVLFVVAGVLL